MKKFIKSILPSFIIRLYKEYIYNRMIFNYFKDNNTKNALLSYIIDPFIEDSFIHTNFYEARSVASILGELGYNVDIIDYRRTANIDLEKYDLIYGFGDVFQKYFESPNVKNTITIYYGAGMHVSHQNQATLTRLRDVFVKKGHWIGKSVRFVEKTWTHQTALVDGIIALGNKICADSYRKYYINKQGLILEQPATFFQTKNAFDIIKNRLPGAKKHYLWFGSDGLIHKGLDILLEYFAANKNLTLHICGSVTNEPDFIKIYKSELNSNNIILHNFIDINSNEFEDILRKCLFVVFPSCSEGGSPSILTVIGNGGLIPIITKETTVDTKSAIFIDSFDYKSLDKSIQESQRIPKNELLNLQIENLKFILQHNSQEAYYNHLKNNIENIIKSRSL